MCGLFQYVEKENGEARVIRRQSRVTLPDKGTKVSRCLGIVGTYYPYSVSTKAVSNQSDCSMDVTASYLMGLMHKGLLERVVDGRGQHGGSRWRLTTVAADKLNIRR